MIQKRLIYADFIRCFAVIAVIFLHTAAYLVYRYNQIPHFWWWIGNFFNSASRWGVPVFIMLSGLLLLDPQKKESMRIFFRKRLFKVLIPFLFWAIIYFDWRYLGGESFSIEKILTNLASGTVYYHFGFIYLIIGLYLSTPIIRRFIKNGENSEISYFVIAWAVFISATFLLRRFSSFGLGFTPEIFTGFLGYFVLGFYLKNLQIDKKYNYLLILMATFALVITLFGTYFSTLNQGGILDEFYYEYLSPNIIIISFVVFYFLKNINYEKYFKPSFLKKIEVFSGAAFGIYLIHPIILEILGIFSINAVKFFPLIGVFLTSGFCIIISLIAIIVIKKIPYLKNIVP